MNTPASLAEAHQVDPSTIRRAALRAKVKGTRVGRNWVFSDAEALAIGNALHHVAGNPNMQKNAAKIGAKGGNTRAARAKKEQRQ